MNPLINIYQHIFGRNKILFITQISEDLNPEDDELEESDEDDDFEESDDEEGNEKLIKDDSVIKSKLTTLGLMLNNIKAQESDEEEESEEEEDDDDDTDASDGGEENDDNKANTAQDKNDDKEERTDDSEDVETNDESDDESKKNIKIKTQKSVKRAAVDDKRNTKRVKVLTEEEEREKYRNKLSKLSGNL